MRQGGEYRQSELIDIIYSTVIGGGGDRVEWET